ncbi:pyridoxamine 5'-phosphate oxidase family protein [Fodinicola feengrottensis]|uniref:Pyridoxamine 5'-phosphate oxidase family protein n=1 Tax=Fodinicola feengrottensis TaxID=435914 RepID=A0ABN2IYF1_9ACTN
MKPSRPRMFGGHADPVLLPWSWAVRTLTDCMHYWIATTRPDGRPHSRPVWGVTIEETVYFSTGSLAVGNLAHSPEVCVHTESATELVILEGTAEHAGDAAVLERIAVAYERKYAEPMTTATMPEFYAVRPRVAFGWLASPTFVDGGSVFHGTNTKWTF